MLPSRPFSPAQVLPTCGCVATTTRTRLSGLRPTSLNDARLVARHSPLNPTRSTNNYGAGITTSCPSALTKKASPLGPTNPPRNTRAAEPSGLRWWGFAPHFSVTHSDIRTRMRSTTGFRCCFAAHSTLPYHARTNPDIQSFGRILCPGELSAPWHSTSELLRTLSRVAASKPTSWLSVHRDILAHSASIWGP